MILNVPLSECNETMSNILQIYDCNLESNYDMSNVVLKKNSETIVVTGSSIYKTQSCFEAEDEIVKELKKCKLKLQELLLNFNATLDTTYDMSQVLIFHKSGYTETFKG